MSASSRRQLGRLGEDLAAEHLAERGLVVRARNWRCARGEIDLVAQDGATLVFVEVKTRRSAPGPTPEDAVTAGKARRLRLLGQHYLLENELDLDWRIDVVGVVLDHQDRLVRCEHWIDAVRGW